MDNQNYPIQPYHYTVMESYVQVGTVPISSFYCNATVDGKQYGMFQITMGPVFALSQTKFYFDHTGTAHVLEESTKVVRQEIPTTWPHCISRGLLVEPRYVVLKTWNSGDITKKEWGLGTTFIGEKRVPALTVKYMPQMKPTRSYFRVAENSMVVTREILTNSAAMTKEYINFICKIISLREATDEQPYFITMQQQTTKADEETDEETDEDLSINRD